MKAFIFLIVLTFTFALNNADDKFEEIDPFLTSNTLAIFAEFPSVVSIRAPGTPRQPNCGGSIIDLQHVLTSAQCVLNAQNQLINPFWYNVMAGDLNLVRSTSRREVRRVTRIFIHPNFNPTTWNNDLAVLRVDQPFPEFHNSIEPTVLNHLNLPTATACRLVAWGAATVALNAPIQPDLRVMNAPILDRGACNAGNVHANAVLLTHICAGSIPATNPQTGACTGNIGSGLYCNDRLAGILSFGQSCGVANRPGVYVDIRQYRDWINSQLLRTDNPQPGWVPSP